MVRWNYLFLILLVCSTRGEAKYKPCSESAKISVKVEDTQLSDTFQLIVYEYYFDRFSSKEIFVSVKDDHKNFGFNLGELNHPVYVSLYDAADHLTSSLFELYLLEPGDDIVVSVIPDKTYRVTRTPNWSFYKPGYRLNFSGKGSAKFLCRYEADWEIAREGSSNTIINGGGEFIQKNHSEKSYDISHRVIDKYKSKFNKFIYNQLKADYFATIELDRLFWLSQQSSLLRDSTVSNQIWANYESKIEVLMREFKPDNLDISIRYPQLISEKILLQYRFKRENRFKVYSRMKSSFRGIILDKAVTYFALNNLHFSYGEEIVEDAIKTVKDAFCLEKLFDLHFRSATGMAAYNFSLADTSGKMVTLNEFKGKVVFLDFWFEGCRGCALYYTNVVSKVEPEFKDNQEVVFVTISIDEDPNKWKRAIRKGLYTSPDIINLNTGPESEENAVIKEFRIRDYPRPLIIDRNGKFFCMDISAISTADELRSMIKKALELKSDN